MSDKTDKDKKNSAIALKYDPLSGRAPTIVAKGHGEIAEKIIELAQEHDVHIHQNPELLDVLIRLELGDEIPEALYRAIAEVIAFAYNIKKMSIEKG
jgi:flagellar biosynthesis protein